MAREMTQSEVAGGFLTILTGIFGLYLISAKIEWAGLLCFMFVLYQWTLFNLIRLQDRIRLLEMEREEE